MSLGVGWLALLILEKGQCESLTTGIGAEEQTPTSFFISKNKLIKNAELGSKDAAIIVTYNGKLLYAIACFFNNFAPR